MNKEQTKQLLDAVRSEFSDKLSPEASRARLERRLEAARTFIQTWVATHPEGPDIGLCLEVSEHIEDGEAGSTLNKLADMYEQFAANEPDLPVLPPQGEREMTRGEVRLAIEAARVEGHRARVRVLSSGGRKTTREAVTKAFSTWWTPLAEEHGWTSCPDMVETSFELGYLGDDPSLGNLAPKK